MIAINMNVATVGMIMSVLLSLSICAIVSSYG